MHDDVVQECLLVVEGEDALQAPVGIDLATRPERSRCKVGPLSQVPEEVLIHLFCDSLCLQWGHAASFPQKVISRAENGVYWCGIGESSSECLPLGL